MIKKIGTALLAVMIPLAVFAILIMASGITPVGSAAEQAFDSGGSLPPGCSLFMIVNVRGTRGPGDPSNMDTVTRAFTSDFTNAIVAGGLSESARSYQYITYDTPTLITLLTLVGISHDLHSGVVNTDNYLLPELKTCWNSFFILDGYSFGAWIVKDVYNALPNDQRQRVLLAAFGDPTFDPFQSWDDGGSYRQWLSGLAAPAQFTGPYTARAGRNNPYPGYTGPQVLDTCLRNDLVCQTLATTTTVHLNGYTPLWTLNAATWAFNRWRAGIPV